MGSLSSVTSLVEYHCYYFMEQVPFYFDLGRWVSLTLDNFDVQIMDCAQRCCNLCYWPAFHPFMDLYLELKARLMSSWSQFIVRVPRRFVLGH
jgi:hypothetical protein